MSKIIACRTSPSLGGGFAGEPADVWNTVDYGWEHLRNRTVFWGMYALRDYLALWLHRGPAWILWAGGDIQNLKSGFVLNDGKLKYISKVIGNKWVYKILNKAEHYVENDVEAKDLKSLGIDAKVVPSFMGNIDDYQIEYKASTRAHVWASVSGGRYEEYGWYAINDIAYLVPEVTFHLYGGEIRTDNSNVICHGRVPKEQMNQEVKYMQGACRLNEHDGFSEVLAKSSLWGQHPISRISYPFIDSYSSTKELLALFKGLKDKPKPNIEGAVYYRVHLNNFIWRTKC